MASGTLQTSGDTTAQLEQAIQTLGGVPSADGKTGLLKQLNAALAAQINSDISVGMGPASAVAETVPRNVGSQSVTIATVATTIYMQAIYIPNNTVVNNINAVLGSTAATTAVTVNWAALCDNTRKVLAVSANATSLISANAVNTLPLSAPFTTQYGGFYYIAYTISATGQPTLAGVTAAGTGLATIVPILQGTSSTTATSTPPTAGTVLGAITPTANCLYEYLT